MQPNLLLLMPELRPGFADNFSMGGALGVTWLWRETDMTREVMWFLGKVDFAASGYFLVLALPKFWKLFYVFF